MFNPRAKREVQTAICCGMRNHRWRVQGSDKFPSGLTNCCRCGKPLQFSAPSKKRRPSHP